MNASSRTSSTRRTRRSNLDPDRIRAYAAADEGHQFSQEQIESIARILSDDPFHRYEARAREIELDLTADLRLIDLMTCEAYGPYAGHDTLDEALCRREAS